MRLPPDHIVYTTEDQDGATTFTYEIFKDSQIFLNCQQIEDMCKVYPTLEKQYRKFRNIYDILINDWNNNHEKKIL